MREPAKDSQMTEGNELLKHIKRRIDWLEGRLAESDSLREIIALNARVDEAYRFKERVERFLRLS